MEFADRYGPWALVAGASEGLGAALADGCASRGCNVLLVARRQALLEETATKLRDAYGVETGTLVADLGRVDIGDVIASTTRDLEVGLFVYNAAFAPQGRFVDVPLEHHIRGVAMNVTTPTVLAHLLGKRMAERGRGGIVLVSSGAANAGMKVFTTYAAGKAYELILGEGLWDELRERGVDAMAYVVGATATPTFTKSTDHDAATATGARTPEEVAAQLFEVLGTGPRAYSHPGDEERAMASAGRPRAEVVAAVGEVISSIWH
jgi:uncharacterized protein